MANVMKKIFGRARPLEKTVYHYRSGGTLEDHRVHLRIESNGSGILIIDADKILYMNQTAAEIVKGMLDGKDDLEIVRTITQRYRVGKDTVSEDLDALRHTIKRFAEAADVDPVTYLSNQDIKTFTSGFSSPHRMDLLLTYENCDLQRRLCFKHTDGRKTLNFEQWKRIIEILWNVGVPHILFAGGESTEFENFVEIVQFAEEVGIVTGLLTNGEKLASMNYVNSLVDVGLDHLQVTIESREKRIHDKLIGDGTWEKTIKGLKNALATPLYCVAHTTFTTKNLAEIPQFVSFLKDLGIYAFAADALNRKKISGGSGLGLNDDEIRNLLRKLSQELRKKEISFIWYGDENIENVDKTSGIWEYSMCIESNGDVTPCSYEYNSFGNILEDEWKSIWSKAIKYSTNQD